MVKNKKICVIIPTYNERENIVPLIKEILALPLEINVFVVDDNSPDGTGYVVEKQFEDDSRVEVFVRKKDRGRGFAGRFGYEKALEKGFDIIGEMDGDFSHMPVFIPDLVRLLDEADASSGSRFIAGGKDLRQGLMRETITRFARIYLRLLVGIKLTDPTSGFRFFRSNCLASISPLLKSRDAFIVTEVFFHVFRKGFRIKEYPIIFQDRRYGTSKLKPVTLFAYLYRALLLRIGLFNG